MSAIDQYDALLLDLDGTLWHGGEPIDGAADFVNSCGMKRGYVTNNASRGPQAVVDKLSRAGIQASADEVITSAQAAVAIARSVLRGGENVLVVGSDSFRDIIAQAGFRVVETAEEDPKAVLQGFDPSVGWEQLSEAAYAIRKGAQYIASNLDSSLPTDRGLAVGNGSLVQAVCHATAATPKSAGKPEPDMYLRIAERLGARRPLAVGDRLDTDIQGGRAAAMDTALVLTGVSGPMELIEAPAERRPTYVCSTLRDLAEDAAVLQPSAQGGFTARADGIDVLLEGGDPGAMSVEALRTVLEVVWAMPEPPRYIHPRSEMADYAVEHWS